MPLCLVLLLRCRQCAAECYSTPFVEPYPQRRRGGGTVSMLWEAATWRRFHRHFIVRRREDWDRVAAAREPVQGYTKRVEVICTQLNVAVLNTQEHELAGQLHRVCHPAYPARRYKNGARRVKRRGRYIKRDAHLALLHTKGKSLAGLRRYRVRTLTPHRRIEGHGASRCSCIDD